MGEDLSQVTVIDPEGELRLRCVEKVLVIIQDFLLVLLQSFPQIFGQHGPPDFIQFVRVLRRNSSENPQFLLRIQNASTDIIQSFFKTNLL